MGHKVAVLGLRPTLPPFTPADFRTLVEDCWHQDPDKRCDLWPLCALKFMNKELFSLWTAFETALLLLLLMSLMFLLMLP